MAYFDANDPIRKQLEENFSTSGKGPTISIDSVTGETMLGSKRNPTAKDWRDAYQGYIAKGGSLVTTPHGMSATRMYQHPLFSGGMSHYSMQPYSATFLREMQENLEDSPETISDSQPSSTIREFTTQQDDGGADTTDPFEAPAGYSGFDAYGYNPASPDIGWPDMGEDFDKSPYSVSSLFTTENLAEAGKALATSAGMKVLENVTKLSLAPVAAAKTIYDISQIDFAQSQIGRWGWSGDDSTGIGDFSQIAGYDSQGVAIDANGNRVHVGQGLPHQLSQPWTAPLAFKDFSSWWNYDPDKDDGGDGRDPSPPSTQTTTPSTFKGYGGTDIGIGEVPTSPTYEGTDIGIGVVGGDDQGSADAVGATADDDDKGPGDEGTEAGWGG